MISPVPFSALGASKAEDKLRREFTRLSRIVRSEIIGLTSNGNTLSIDFPSLDRGIRPKIRAIYEDGASEPEVYTDRTDWYNFNTVDYLDYSDKSDNILMMVIRLELRKALQGYLNVSQIPDTLLEFCLLKNGSSAVEITAQSKLSIHFVADSYQIRYDIGPRNQVALYIWNTDSAEVPPFVKLFSLTDLTDVEGFAKHQIGNMKDAIHIADEVLRQVSHSYAFERWAGEFPSAEFHLPKGNLKIELMSDYANIRVSVNGTYEDFPIGNLDIDDIKRKILTITSR